MNRFTVYLGTFLCMTLFGCLAGWAINRAIEYPTTLVVGAVIVFVMLLGAISSDLLKTARKCLKQS